MQSIRVALAGNPNAGKSTIFNALTGARQHVGNWPGKTIEKKAGSFRRNGTEVSLIDLPGTYSLSAYSLEEIIARDFILNKQPDVVVTVVDAANLERNLYLVVQVLELGVPVIVALNMSDRAEARGLEIDHEQLSAALGCPVIRTVGHKKEGINELIEAILGIGVKEQV
jgi:ferrous iron transport protein B